MPVFTAIAAAVTTFAAGITWGSVAAFAARTLLTIGVSKLLADRANRKAPGTQDAGARIQLAPATNNKLPVVYGSAFVAPVITDAKISTDNKMMWYVMALSETTDSGAITFGDIYYDGKLVTFDNSDPYKVVSLTNNANPPQVDTKVNGKIYIYRYTNGSSSNTVPGGPSAISVLQDANIEASQRWTATDLMSNCAFMIVKVFYNQDADTVGMPQMTVKLTNSLTKPGDVILDYMQNARYGCAIPSNRIDTASLTALNTYSDELITYTPVGGGSATQARYRINGPINTGQNCLANLQELADSCDSWIQYSELTAQWKIVINQSYTDYTSIGNLYHVTSSNLIGGIDVNPIDLNATYNSLEVQYPNTNIKDQTDFKVLELEDYLPGLLSPNEAENRLTIQYPQVNNYVQAVYLGVRRLLQSREDLVITCGLDYSGIQIEAGDVIRVTHEEYGWMAPAFPDGKLFRVSQVQEVKDQQGFLGVRITAFEYNDTVYADDPIQDFVPADNTGLTDPNVIGTPIAPTVVLDVANTIAVMKVTGTVPTEGLVRYLDFNVGTTNNSAQHTFYTSTTNNTGEPLVGNVTFTINSTDLAANTYYWSVTARNDTVAVRGPASNSVVWAGPTVTTYNANTNTGGVGFNQVNTSLEAMQPLKYWTIAVADPGANTYTGPGNIADPNVSVNDPIYIDGVSVGTNYIYPYFQGTATTANGYLANSTASMQPPLAALKAQYSGTDGWYTFSYESIASTPINASQYLNIQMDGVFVSNANAVLQVLSFVTAPSTPAVMYSDTLQIESFELPANTPIYVTLDHSITGGAIDGGGVMIRNITGGTRITGIYAENKLNKGNNP